MVLEAAFSALTAQFHTLQEAFLQLHIAIAEDKPGCDEQDDVALIDIIKDITDDLLGWLGEAQSCAVEGMQAASYPTDLACARYKLAKCQEIFNQVSLQFSNELISYDRVEDLMSLGRERETEWLNWAQNVKASLEECKRPLYEVNQKLFQCWLEIAELAWISSLSSQTVAEPRK